ncbi:MAG: pyrroline-5-carboxylate reductase [Chlamydiae bacterium]|nr:pyrroline-5-carboxylate reductase [Chlamydiota bacterium]MBI3276351.1 pyrroline-5-carboxylate reductase [Chlamydiota bacterium]
MATTLTLKNKKILFIGAGNMAEAILQGLLNSGKADRSSIAVTEVKNERRDFICQKFEIHFFENNSEGVKNSDLILFAVKPQNIDEVLKEIAAVPLRNKIFISIAAGVPIERFEKALGKGARIIRVMPNMPALVGQGISGISRGMFSSSEDENLAEEMMSSVGEVVRVPENLLDAVTAVSGSGPAYFFYLMEALQKAGTELGLSEEISNRLVKATALGASMLVKKSEESIEVLRKKVTSPGGTTEAAIHLFQKKGLSKIVIEGVCAAEKRSKELRGK